jgi:Carbohydrate-selective porin, OprB family
MMQSFALACLARSAFLGALVGVIWTGFYGAGCAAIAAQPQSTHTLATIKSNHWAFQSLKSLVERYGCVINSSGLYFQPSATPSRYEMAAAVNECLDQIADHFTTPKDYVIAQALVKEFKPEMDVLRSRVPQDCRAATLESQQFSTSPIPQGEVVLFGTESSSELALKTRAVTPDIQHCSLTTKVIVEPEFYAQFPGLQPTHWSFQAIQSLSMRYHCTPNLSNTMSRKGTGTSRYEMAVSINTCLNRIGHRFANQKDLEIAQALQKEFKPELAALIDRSNSLKNRTEALKFNQFSTTTKFQGQAIITIQGGGFR